jgi:hypothetical protein
MTRRNRAGAPNDQGRGPSQNKTATVTQVPLAIERATPGKEEVRSHYAPITRHRKLPIPRLRVGLPGGVAAVYRQ